MRRLFLILLLTFTLIPLIYAFESPVYSIDVGVGTTGINVNIGQGIDVNITNGTCVSGQTTCVGTNYYLCVDSQWVNQGNVNGQCGYTIPPLSVGGGAGDAGTILGFFPETEANNVSNLSNEENGTIKLNGGKGPKETNQGINFFTGAVTGIGNFVKSGAGLVVLFILVITGLAVVLTLYKNKVKKEEPQSSKETESESK